MLDQLGHCLGVCVRLEDEALGGEELLDLLVVGDDPVVHHHKLVVLARPLGMTVDVRGCSMSSPPGVCNTNMFRVNPIKVEFVS